jgi:hypothetical protein
MYKTKKNVSRARTVKRNMKKSLKELKEKYKPITRKELKKIHEELYKKDKKNLLLLDNKSAELFKLCLRKYYRSPKNCNFYRKYKM